MCAVFCAYRCLLGNRDVVLFHMAVFCGLMWGHVLLFRIPEGPQTLPPEARDSFYKHQPYPRHSRDGGHHGTYGSYSRCVREKEA